jgi:hypothetical protein
LIEEFGAPEEVALGFRAVGFPDLFLLGVAERLQAARLKLGIYRKLAEQGAVTPEAIGAALDLPATEALRF